MENDKLALRASSAGIRFIAQMTIYNSGSVERLRQYIADSYHERLLAAESVGQRLEDFQALFSRLGRMKVKQVLAANKEHAIVIVTAENNDGIFYTELKVEDDYPHKIIHYLFVQMREVTEPAE
ncbi:MAG: hypothetical protein MUE40_21570 [Anaerolineae bacterium]|jgi:hypothetical protein|nr:hypothetical protein [Anaerolineae bacterium]